MAKTTKCDLCLNTVPMKKHPWTTVVKLMQNKPNSQHAKR